MACSRIHTFCHGPIGEIRPRIVGTARRVFISLSSRVFQAESWRMVSACVCSVRTLPRILAHDIVLYRADKTEIGKGHTSRPNCWRVAKRLKRHAKNWLRGGCRLCRDLPESAELSCLSYLQSATFVTTHNPKVAGSNPAPATKSYQQLTRFGHFR